MRWLLFLATLAEATPCPRHMRYTIWLFAVTSPEEEFLPDRSSIKRRSSAPSEGMSNWREIVTELVGTVLMIVRAVDLTNSR